MKWEYLINLFNNKDMGKIKRREVRFVVSDHLYEKVLRYSDEYGENVGSFVRHLLIERVIDLDLLFANVEAGFDSQYFSSAVARVMHAALNDDEFRGSEDLKQFQDGVPAFLRLIRAIEEKEDDKREEKIDELRKSGFPDR